MAISAEFELEGLYDYATERQREILDAVKKHGSYRQAAQALDVHHSYISRTMQSIRSKAAARGWAPNQDLAHPTPEGQHVRGISTLYGEDGQLKAQWVKTERAKEEQFEALKAAAEEVAECYEGKYEPGGVPAYTDDDLLGVVVQGDPHFGMLAWSEEVGEDFDLKIAERDTLRAVDLLMMQSPPSKTVVLLNVGDYFHTDNSNNMTLRSNNILDVDSRWAKMLQVGIHARIACIEAALCKHDKVIVKDMPGNHDEHSAIFMSAVLAAHFRHEPRVEVDTSPNPFWYYQHGSVLIGSTHGDGIKQADLHGIMSVDCRDIWSSVEYRYWYTGHVHHTSKIEKYETPCESFRTLAGKDAWHHKSGYRSGQDITCITHHKDYGEVARNVVPIKRARA